MFTAPGGAKRIAMITAQSADETTSQPINVQGYVALTVYVTGTGTTSSGVITIEEADYNEDLEGIYSGTWSSIATVNASDVSGGQQLAYHIGGPGGVFSYSHIRTRISTVIGGGGSISTALVAV